jgi:hypothetical protein
VPLGFFPGVEVFGVAEVFSRGSPPPLDLPPRDVVRQKCYEAEIFFDPATSVAAGFSG